MTTAFMYWTEQWSRLRDSEKRGRTVQTYAAVGYRSYSLASAGALSGAGFKGHVEACR